jgi:hypothetical protein
MAVGAVSGGEGYAPAVNPSKARPETGTASLQNMRKFRKNP